MNKKMSEIKVTKAEARDLQMINELFQNAIISMEKNGIHQWDEIYPTIEDLKRDISNEQMYIVKRGIDIVAVYVLNKEYEEAYSKGAWNYNGDDFIILHRLCVNPLYQNQGYATWTMKYLEKCIKEAGIKSIRLDTFTQNPYSIRLYSRLGFVETGIVEWRMGKFLLMEKCLI